MKVNLPFLVPENFQDQLFSHLPEIVRIKQETPHVEAFFLNYDKIIPGSKKLFL